MRESLNVIRIAKYNKLTLYTQVRKEPYLDTASPCIRTYIAALRLSCHRLPTGTGRHEWVPREQRLCKFCNYALGDEKHYFMECYHPILSRIRKQFRSRLFQINPVLQYLSRDSLIRYIVLF